MTDLLDLPELLDPVVTSGRSRAIAAGVDANEYDAICASLNAASEWSAAFRRAGAAHRTLAEIAEQAGHRVTAGDAYLAAAACSHIATTVPTPDRVGDQEAADAMRHALTLLEPTFQQLAGPSFCGVLLTQPDNLHAPLVVIVPGVTRSPMPSAHKQQRRRHPSPIRRVRQLGSGHELRRAASRRHRSTGRRRR